MCVSPSESPDNAQPCRILLVEDNPINQKVVTLMLRKYGIIPALANQGTVAIEAVQASKFDLILMDLHMPGMTGFEASRQIHELLGEDCPPVVALTADLVQGNETMIEKNGLNGFLTKPITSQTLRKCIEEHTGIIVGD